MYCKNCGTQIEDTAKFCGSCGSSQSDVASYNSAISQQNVLLDVELQKKNLLIAGGANLLFPGIGYFYAGSIVWGVIIILAFFGAIYVGDPTIISTIYLLSILGSVYQAYKYNKKIIQDQLISSRQQYGSSEPKIEKGIFD